MSLYVTAILVCVPAAIAIDKASCAASSKSVTWVETIEIARSPAPVKRPCASTVNDGTESAAP